jgi:hypothetical protein
MAPRHQIRYRIVSVALVAMAMLLLLLCLLQHHFDGATYPASLAKAAIAKNHDKRQSFEVYTHASELKPPVSTGQDKRIYADLQIENIYNLSLRDRVFMAEGWYWLKWTDTVNAIIKDNQIPLENILGFTNQIEADSLVVRADQPNPERLDNGYYWRMFRFSGKFYIENLELRGFPFDVLTLPIVLQLQSDALSCYPGNRYGCISLVLDNEAKGSTLGEYVSLNGYKIIGSERQEFLHQYTSNFGQGDLSAFASIRYNILYNTDFGAAFWAYIFPLLILVTVVIISPSLPGSLGDVRLAIPTTILLTLIFLQIGYKADLPALAYVTYLDWLYIYAYVVSASLFILFCWGTNAHANALAQGNEESMVRRINRVDFLMQAIAFVGLVMILATGLLFEA